MEEKIAGKVIHYYDKAMVVVVRLSVGLTVGDMIKVAKNEDAFEMKISSMQLDHQPVDSGKAGEEVAIKVDSPAKEGAVVFKISK